jgi:hypothetical protein
MLREDHHGIEMKRVDSFNLAKCFTQNVDTVHEQGPAAIGQRCGKKKAAAFYEIAPIVCHVFMICIVLTFLMLEFGWMNEWSFDGLRYRFTHPTRYALCRLLF